MTNANSRSGNKNQNKKKKPQPKYATRSRATRVLANGVGAVPRNPFGSSGSGSPWDAKHPSHLALPRAVGPYSVIRATRRVQVSTHCNIIGTFLDHNAAHAKEWTSLCMLSDVAAGTAINGAGNCQTTAIPISGLGDAATLVPSAVSVQIMCPTALQTASGIVYAGCMNTQAAIDGRTETWTSYFDRFVQFQSPRLLAASKLALRGVQIDSYPLNMSQCADFTPVRQLTDATTTLNDSAFESAGWAPIMVYNPGGADLELLITVEYRVRFDLENPASASHRYYPPSTDRQWATMMQRAQSLGNGVRDIADVVANIGQAIGRVRHLALTDAPVPLID